ncbi:MAG TPA: hypothetical protein VFO46_20400 [Candidatus Sulfotelmatobacter sp.]|nr:hypothetical protein [Candidatus Sulfotelmatobacter sp.]
MSTKPVENLELRAIEQRNEIHQTTAELKEKIAAARQRYDVSANLRQRFTTIAIVVSCLGLIAGYGVGGVFSRR